MSDEFLKVTPDRFDSIFRLLDREVWVVTSGADHMRGGLLATWISQASIDPTRPLVLLGIAPNHFTGHLIRESGRFGLHLLKQDQADLALNFAIGSGRDRDKFKQTQVESGPLGTPRLTDALAWMEGRVIHCLDGGDRLYLWGQIEYASQQEGGSPLTEQKLISEASAAQKVQLRENHAYDCEIQRPMAQKWLSQIENGSSPG
ncbi:MAG: flavin reductase family protein [Planctomycetota bacterium]|nr:flavin reductase family protein [Planctomycetota bacterium]